MIGSLVPYNSYSLYKRNSPKESQSVDYLISSKRITTPQVCPYTYLKRTTTPLPLLILRGVRQGQKRKKRKTRGRYSWTGSSVAVGRVGSRWVGGWQRQMSISSGQLNFSW